MFKADIPTLIKEAGLVIRAERSRYDSILMTVMAHTREHKLQISAPSWAINNVVPDSFIIWSQNALHHATELANEIYTNHTHVVYVKTILPYDEFEIWVFGRTLFTVARYPQIKHVNMTLMFNGPMLDRDEFGQITFLNPEIELIRQYHTLYMPFPDLWPKAAILEAALHITSGGRKHETKHSNSTPYTIIRQLRRHIFDALKSYDLGILIGHWAIFHITGDDPQSEKIQIVLHHSLTPEIFVKKLGGILRDVSSIRMQHRTEDVHAPGDYWLQRTTYYVGDSVDRIALMDTFNCQQYELVPYVLQEGIKIGGAYLICRLFMIDRWILSILESTGRLKSEVVRAKIDILYKRIAIVRTLDRFKFVDQYEGIWKDPVIEKRRVIRTQDKKFPPYYPAQYEKQFGKLRIV
jgi:hypothetical protein